jgi:hypothetical protein
MSKLVRSTKHSMVKPLNILPLLSGQEILVADADGDELVVATRVELGDRVVVETTVVVAAGLVDGVTVETTVVVAIGDGLEDEDSTGAELETEDEATGGELDAGDELDLELETSDVVATEVGEVLEQELMICVEELVTNTVEVEVLVRVVVAEAEVNVVVAAGWTTAVAVWVRVEVTETVLVATVEAAGDVPKVAINS